jgi:hypothetical protein
VIHLRPLAFAGDPKGLHDPDRPLLVSVTGAALASGAPGECVRLFCRQEARILGSGVALTPTDCFKIMAAAIQVRAAIRRSGDLAIAFAIATVATVAIAIAAIATIDAIAIDTGAQDASPDAIPAVIHQRGTSLATYRRSYELAHPERTARTANLAYRSLRIALPPVEIRTEEQEKAALEAEAEDRRSLKAEAEEEADEDERQREDEDTESRRTPSDKDDSPAPDWEELDFAPVQEPPLKRLATNVPVPPPQRGSKPADERPGTDPFSQAMAQHVAKRLAGAM